MVNKAASQQVSVDEIISKVVEKLKPTIAAAAQTSTQTLERIEKKVDRKRKYDAIEIQNKGNKEQFNHVLQMFDVINDIDESIEKNNVRLEKEYVEKGKKLLHERIKLITIADKNDWLTATEY